MAPNSTQFIPPTSNNVKDNTTTMEEENLTNETPTLGIHAKSIDLSEQHHHQQQLPSSLSDQKQSSQQKKQPLIHRRKTTTNRRTRSNSAPARFRNRSRRHRLVDQHYKIDKEKRLLPGVPEQEEDFARDCHDFFNLIFLVPLVVLNILNWNWDELLSGSLEAHVLQTAWHGEYFHSFFLATILYFFTDLLWVWIIPKCVKSPGTIIQHHIATFLYLIIPYYYDDFRWAMGVCMSVEINTWFLIARRVFNRQGFPPWTIDVPFMISIRVKLISICFYISWISIRCMVYPYMLLEFVELMRVRMDGHGGSTDIMMVTIPIHTVFCFLNARWTYDLANSKIRQWKSKGKITRVQSGL